MPARLPCRWSAACHRYPRTRRSCDLWDDVPHALRAAGHIQRVMREHLVVGAALRKRQHADAKNARRWFERELGDRGGEHLALAAFQIVIVEREDVTPTANHFPQPSQIDAIEPGQVDQPNAGTAALLDFLGRFERV